MCRRPKGNVTQRMQRAANGIMQKDAALRLNAQLVETYGVAHNHIIQCLHESLERRYSPLKDFEICAVGGLLPIALNAQWILSVGSACGGAADYGDQCDAVQKAVLASIKLR